MDVELENVVKLIFPDGVPEELEDNPQLVGYLNKLGTYNVEQLSKEQDHLSEEKTVILNQTKDLASTNYKTFIKTAECSREIFQQFGKTEERLKSLIKDLPEFSSSCQEFNEKSNGIKSRRRLNTLLLTLNAQLLQILEIPQLLHHCIHNNLYEEALQLAAYVRKLGNRHSNIPIIAGLVEDVEKLWWSLMDQLVANLRTDIQLPRCLQVIGFLRRMDIFTESELKLKFLQARDTWLQSLLSTIPTNDASHHLSKTIELSRIHLFNILTQFRAVFSYDDTSAKRFSVFESGLFYSWINLKIQIFLDTLEEDLKLCPFSSLDSLLGQCMYFGLSFSRVGADFRALAAPIFLKKINDHIEKNMEKTDAVLASEMDTFALPKAVYSGIKSNTNLELSSGQEHPPSKLLDFHPLANYCNNLLNMFNELRLCAPLNVAQNVTQLMQSSLRKASSHIKSFYRQEQQALTSNEREMLTRLCQCYSYEFVPFIQRCIHAIFPPHQIAKHLGISQTQLHRMNLTYLDESNILDPINHLLPVTLVQSPASQSTTSLKSDLTPESITGPSSQVQPSSPNDTPFSPTASTHVELSTPVLNESAAQRYGNVPDSQLSTSSQSALNPDLS
ncbi:unnamed protein product [Bemisia tabaci]|uniref:Conserved oligomeric Golgi complex subunit 8 n=1 Tax=Bemisia tabaci TaxID=7038 RepID=A0A9P0A8D6_BEMTA|nr:unnamed protein product [Bemisia tabaci]